MKFKNSYIHTTSVKVSPVNRIYQQSIYHHSKTCLLSLIHCLSSNSFGYVSLLSGLTHLEHFKNDWLTNDEVYYYDSGGYSIIAGDVSPMDAYKFIDCYTLALEKHREIYDFIFSLDIPIFLSYPEKNTKANIYEYNWKSLTESIKKIQDFPEIKSKFCFVNQFKLKSQYEIWGYLYKHLEMHKYHQNFAIGGLVGLSATVNLQFAPFIAPLYWQLYQYHEHSNLEYPFYSHILGIYHRSYRFMLYFMMELFNRYLNPDQNAYITYDTINYTISSMYKSKVGLDYYDIDSNEKLIVYHSHDLTDGTLSGIYKTEHCLQSYHNNLERIDAGEPLTDTTFLVPLNISSQLNLDKFFQDYIKKYNLVDILIQHQSNPTKFINNIRPFIRSLSTFPTLTSNFTGQVIESLRIVSIFHHWYITNKSDKTKLDDLMYQFIAKINFPFELG